MRHFNRQTHTHKRYRYKGDTDTATTAGLMRQVVALGLGLCDAQKRKTINDSPPKRNRDRFRAKDAAGLKTQARVREADWSAPSTPQLALHLQSTCHKRRRRGVWRRRPFQSNLAIGRGTNFMARWALDYKASALLNSFDLLCTQSYKTVKQFATVRVAAE